MTTMYDIDDEEDEECTAPSSLVYQIHPTSYDNMIEEVKEYCSKELKRINKIIKISSWTKRGWNWKR